MGTRQSSPAAGAAPLALGHSLPFTSVDHTLRAPLRAPVARLRSFLAEVGLLDAAGVGELVLSRRADFLPSFRVDPGGTPEIMDLSRSASVASWDRFVGSAAGPSGGCAGEEQVARSEGQGRKVVHSRRRLRWQSMVDGAEQ